jgi:hypothetical protein
VPVGFSEGPEAVDALRDETETAARKGQERLVGARALCQELARRVAGRLARTAVADGFHPESIAVALLIK